MTDKQTKRREYRKYDDKISALREAEASDEFQKIIEETRQVRQRSPHAALAHTISLPDFSRALSHRSGGGVMVRARSPGSSSSPYHRSNSGSPVRSPSPKVVTLSHRETFKLPQGSGNTLQIPNLRQRSNSDSKISYRQEVVCLNPEVVSVSPEVMMVPVFDNHINTNTYTSPQADPPPARVRVIQRSPSSSRRNTVAGNIQPPDCPYNRKASLPVGYQFCPEIIVSHHDTNPGVSQSQLFEGHSLGAYFNPDTPESDHSSVSGDLFKDVLEEQAQAQLTEILDSSIYDSAAMNDILENLHINSASPQTEDQSSNLTTLTTQPSFYFQSEDLSHSQEFLMSHPVPGQVISQEFAVNNALAVEEAQDGSQNWEIPRYSK